MGCGVGKVGMMSGIAQVSCASTRGRKDNFKITGWAWRAVLGVKGAESRNVAVGGDAVTWVQLTVGCVEGINVLD